MGNICFLLLFAEFLPCNLFSLHVLITFIYSICTISSVMASREQVLTIIRSKGPLIPAVIAKELKMDLLIAQAHLSELSSSKLVNVSSIKVGGSPLYYLDGQQNNLQKFSERLGEKDLNVYNILKKEKVLRESEVAPLTRVSLKQLKDFAVPLQVQTGEKVEIFWKWYMLSNEEVSPLIREIIHGPEVGAPKEEVAEGEASEVSVQKEPLPTKKEEEPMSSASSPDSNNPLRSRPEIQQLQEKIRKEAKEMETPIDTTSIPQPKFLKIPVQKTLKESSEAMKKQKETGDEFVALLDDYFSEKGIKVVEITILRKRSEVECLLLLPTTVGDIEFYCRAKNKKKVNEGDLSVAYLEGQNRKLPTIFLTTGEVPKKLQPQLTTKFKGMVYLKFDA